MQYSRENAGIAEEFALVNFRTPRAARESGQPASRIECRNRRAWHIGQIRVWTAEEDAEGARLLRLGHSYRQVGLALRRHPDLVGRRNRQVWGVSRLPRTWLNEGFFDEWNPVMAYVVGFILADGCLKRDRKWVSITQMERPILEDIARAMGHCGRIYQERRGAYRLEFRSERVWRRLFELGIVPAKSKVAVLPAAPHSCIPHLVRGYFDGNGAVCVRDRGKKPLLSISIATGSEALKSGLAALVRDELGIECSFSKYEVRILGHHASKRFLLWLYAERDKSLHLRRKFERFEAALEKRIAWKREVA